MHRNFDYQIDQYLIERPGKLYALYIFGMFAWLAAVYGFVRFMSLNFWYAVIFGPVVLFLTVYQCLSFWINLHYKPFNTTVHRIRLRRFWDRIVTSPNRGPVVGNDLPTVDIFLPICGEDSNVLSKTFGAVRGLQGSAARYAQVKVYVLDDADNKAHKQLAGMFGFNYSVRDNRGHMKKAGNIKHGFERSNGDYIIIFDADFAPHKDFIYHLLPYMLDEDVAIVQSPQYFQVSDKVHSDSYLEFGAGNIQEDFYRVIQPARDRFNGAICVGSNAIYRRKALLEVGGPAQIEHSEDVHTGFDLIARGWKIKYVPLILAIGLCPDTFHAFFHQQNRWCTGSMSMLTSKKFWAAKLPITTKLCYISGFMYYISQLVIIVMSFQTFFLLFFNFEWIELHSVLPFLPIMLFSFILLPLFRQGKAKYGTFIARTAASRAYIYALLNKLLGRSLAWQPTGTQRGSVSNAYKRAIAINSAYLGLYLVLTGLAIYYGRFPLLDWQYWSVLFWVFFFIVSNVLYIMHMLAEMHGFERYIKQVIK